MKEAGLVEKIEIDGEISPQNLYTPGHAAFGNPIGEPITDHAARYYKFESISLQRRVRCKPVSRGIRLSRSRSRGFPRLSEPGRAAWVGRDTRAREYLAERR